LPSICRECYAAQLDSAHAAHVPARIPRHSGAALATLPFVRSVDALSQAANPVFRHGVASGDPLSDRVVIWTRVTPLKVPGAENVSWVVSRDERFTSIVAQGSVATSATIDYTVKVDVEQLQPATTYY
jgi:alkaline phosphatase D